jgi:hypothetical protein
LNPALQTLKSLTFWTISLDCRIFNVCFQPSILVSKFQLLFFLATPFKGDFLKKDALKKDALKKDAILDIGGLANEFAQVEFTQIEPPERLWK